MHMRMQFDYDKCEEENDARQGAEIILRCLGYKDVRSDGWNGGPGIEDVILIARCAEKIAEWARKSVL